MARAMQGEKGARVTVTGMRADTKARLLAEDAADLSDAELLRVFKGAVLPHIGIEDARRARESGVTIDDILLEALREPFFANCHTDGPAPG